MKKDCCSLGYVGYSSMVMAQKLRKLGGGSVRSPRFRTLRGADAFSFKDFEHCCFLVGCLSWAFSICEPNFSMKYHVRGKRNLYRPVSMLMLVLRRARCVYSAISNLFRRQSDWVPTDWNSDFRPHLGLGIDMELRFGKKTWNSGDSMWWNCGVQVTTCEVDAANAYVARHGPELRCLMVVDGQMRWKYCWIAMTKLKKTCSEYQERWVVLKMTCHQDLLVNLVNYQC